MMMTEMMKESALKKEARQFSYVLPTYVKPGQTYVGNIGLT